MVKRLLSPKLKHGFKCLNSWDDRSRCLRAAVTNTRLCSILCTRNPPSFRKTVQKISGRQEKKHPAVHREQMFCRSSSALARLCQSAGNFHPKPTDLLAAHSMPFGKTGLLRPPPGDSSCTQTAPEQQGPIPGLQLPRSWGAALRFAGGNSGSCQETQGANRGGLQGARAAGCSASGTNRLKQENSYVSSSNISKGSTFQWHQNAPSKRWAQSLLA